MYSQNYPQYPTSTQHIIPNRQLSVAPAVQASPWNGKVYRLLRPDEYAEYVIFAKSQNSVVSAAFHVAWGSSKHKKNSKYISTCLNRNDALSISLKNYYKNGDIVSINVGDAQVSVLHVWKADVRTQLNAMEHAVDLDTIT